MKIGFGTLVLAAIAIIIAVCALLLISAGAPTISSSSTVFIQKNGSYDFYLPSDSNVSSVYLVKSSAANVTLYIGKRPLLLNDLAEVHLRVGHGVNLSTVNSGSADLSIALVSSTPDSAKLTLTYLPADFGAKPSPGVTILAPSGQVQSAPPSGAATTVAATTTLKNPTTAATTAASTTTVQQENLTAQAIIGANKTSIGSIANGFNQIFKKEALQCTQQIYDNEFAKAFGYLPSGPTTFKNASLTTPQTMKATGANVAANIYNITYAEVVQAGTRPFATIGYNLTGQFIVSSTYKSDFGSSYQAIFENYTMLNATTDPCAVYGV